MEPQIYSQLVRSRGNNLDLPLASEVGVEEEEFCRTESLTCRSRQDLQVDSNRTELDCRILLVLENSWRCGTHPTSELVMRTALLVYNGASGYLWNVCPLAQYCCPYLKPSVAQYFQVIVPKAGPQAGHINITWEIVRNAHLWAHPRFTDSVPGPHSWFQLVLWAIRGEGHRLGRLPGFKSSLCGLKLFGPGNVPCLSVSLGSPL